MEAGAPALDAQVSEMVVGAGREVMAGQLQNDLKESQAQCQKLIAEKVGLEKDLARLRDVEARNKTLIAENQKWRTSVEQMDAFRAQVPLLEVEFKKINKKNKKLGKKNHKMEKQLKEQEKAFELYEVLQKAHGELV